MKIRRVLVLGAGGMLGHKMFQKAVSQGHDTWGTLRLGRADYPITSIKEFESSQIIEHCDMADEDRVNAVLEELQPNVVVNCVGVIKKRSAAKGRASVANWR